MEGEEQRGGVSLASNVTEEETPPTVRRHENLSSYCTYALFIYL